MSNEDRDPTPSNTQVPRWVWWIGGVVLLNVLSQVFHWGFVFY